MVEHLTQFTDNKEFEINLPNRKEFLEDNKNNKFNKLAIFDINGFGNINH